MSASFINFPDLEIWDKQTFTSGGTFTVPSRVNQVFVLGAGGGGGGGGDSVSGGSGFGGCGAVPELISVNTTPNANISVTIGSGGAGNSVEGNPGTDSLFGSYRFLGAPSSAGVAANEYEGYRPSGSYSMGGASFGSSGKRTHFANGGSGGAGPGNAGSGGGAGYGAGGTGGASAGGGGANPTNGGISAGGGGAGAGSGDDGGNGGNGIIIVYWVKVLT